eukprot:1407771-Rhodomonas_salina.1
MKNARRDSAPTATTLTLPPSTPAEADAILDGTTVATMTTAAMEEVAVLTMAVVDTNCMIASDAMGAVIAMPTGDGLVEAVGLVTETVMVAPVGVRGAMTIAAVEALTVVTVADATSAVRETTTPAAAHLARANLPVH